MKNEKKFQLPEAILVTFSDKDVIATSNDWGDPDYDEGSGDEWEND